MNLKQFEQEKIIFYAYGNFDKELFVSESKRRPEDKRLFYIIDNIIDVQDSLAKSIFGNCDNQISLINAINYFTNKNIIQDHNALNDAKLLKLLYENIGIPNIGNIIMAEKQKCVKRIKKLYKKNMIKNNKLNLLLKEKTKESLKQLTFEEISGFVNMRNLKKDIKNDYWILTGKKYLEEFSI